MAKIPKHYKEHLPRVSEICESIFPFEGTDSQKWFRKWLKGLDVSEEEYMKEASEGGTFIHKQLEKYLLGEEPETSKYDDWVINGIEALEDLEVEHIHLEKYVSNDRIQGTVDNLCKLVYKNKKIKKALVDYKTWGLSKELLLPYEEEKKHKKPTDKLKKATIQLSLYRRILGEELPMFIIELTRETWYIYELKYIGDKKCEKLINQWYEKKNSGENTKL